MSNEVEPQVTDAEVLKPEEQNGTSVFEESPDESPAEATADAAETEPEASSDAPSDEDTAPEATREDVAAETEDQSETPAEVPAEVTAEAEETPDRETEEQAHAESAQSEATAEGEQAAATEVDEADEEPAETSKALSLDEIEPGKEYEGVVRNIQAYGAFVDIGAESDGLVHISELRDGYVDKVEDVVSVNEKITVRVKEVDAERGRISLTMREPGQQKEKKKSLRQIREGEEYTGIVTSIVDFGAFIDIGATNDGLVHISELSDDRVNRVEDVVSEGEEVTVRVLNVDKRRKRISLSMRPPEETDFTYDEEEEEEDTPTLIELAFARAAEEAEEEEKRTRRQKKTRNSSSGLSDIIRRTIDDHESNS